MSPLPKTLGKRSKIPEFLPCGNDNDSENSGSLTLQTHMLTCGSPQTTVYVILYRTLGTQTPPDSGPRTTCTPANPYLKGRDCPRARGRKPMGLRHL